MDMATLSIGADLCEEPRGILLWRPQCTMYNVHTVYVWGRVKAEIPHTLDPSLLSFLVVPLVRELRSTRSCDFLNRGSVSDKRNL